MSRKQKSVDRMTRGERVIAFIERHCLIPEGSKVGQPMVLAPFQKKFILELYDNKHTSRRGYLSIARKNGKTALIAAIMLAHIIGPEAQKNSQIVSGALSRDQAALVFSLAAKMLDLNPEFAGLYRLVHSGKRIYGLVKNVEYKALAADGTTAHGISPILAILDEVGQIVGPSSPFVDAITTSQGAHDTPLLLAISTQASSDADLLSLWIDDAERSGDPHTVCHVYAADADADLMDKKQWKKANPALGLFRSEKDLREQLTQAARMPSQEASARNLLLNQRISLHSLWIAPTVWKENAGAIDRALFERLPVHVGLDLSMRNDLTAAVLAVRADDGTAHVWPHVFIPSDGLEDKARRDRAPYDAWVRDGYMVAVPGRVVDYAWVVEYLRMATADMLVASVQFDRWSIENFRQASVGVGFEPMEWVPVGQGFRDFSPRMKALEGALLAGKIRHGGHPLLNMAVSNAVAVNDPAGNTKLDKAKSALRIDPLVALVMAAYPCLDGAQAPSVFDLDAFIA